MNEASSSKLTRRDALKATAATIAGFLLSSSGAASFSSATGISTSTAKSLGTILSWLQDVSMTEGSSVAWMSAYNLRLKDRIANLSESALQDETLPGSMQNILKRITASQPSDLGQMASDLVKELRRIAPKIYEETIEAELRKQIAADERALREVSEEWRRVPKKKPAKSSGKPNRQAAESEPLLSTDTQQVIDDINNLTRKGRTGREPFTERLYQKGQHIVLKQ